MAAEHTTDDESIDDSSDDQSVACSLTPERARDRMEWAEEALAPDLRDITVEDDHVTWTFDRTDAAIEGVTEFARRESACCGFATITVTIPPERPISFEMDVPEGSAEALLTQFEDVVDLRELA